MKKKINFFVKLLQEFFSLLIIVDHRVFADIRLEPSNGIASENTSFTWNCTFSPIDSFISWKVNDNGTSYIDQQKCTGTGFLNERDKYKTDCGTGWISVQIRNVNRNNNGEEWHCQIVGTFQGQKVTLQVQVPVVNVSLHLVGPSSSFIKEHSRQTIKCKTSPGRPQPNASWFLYEANKNVKHKITVNSSIQIISSGAGLKSVESTLQFYPNRSINGWMLNCEAWTNNETRALQSKKLTLNIAYPPDGPPVISGFENGGKYPLIESEIGKLSCTTHGGNPLATLTWKCYNNKPESTTIEDKNVSSTVTWSGLRDQSSCSCISNYSWSGTTQTTTIQIDVLYSPNKPTLTISNTEVSNVINVILNNTVHVKCESKSKPHPTYSWAGPADMQRTIQILNVTINDTKDRKYICIATNRMVRQNGTYVDGRNESDVTIKVLYPPGKPYFKYEYSNGTKVSTQNMIDVIAGDSFSVHCLATGNPQPTNKWNSNEGNDILKIISITFDTNKTCNTMYTMEETVGERRTGSTSASFFIRVLYPPHIPKFTISNGTRQVNVTTATIQLKETDNMNITCFSDGKPVPKYTWTSHNVQILENIRQFANIFRKDAGKYTCNVSNVMERSFGDTEHGLNVSSIYLDILYPSTISSLEDISILEGSDLNETCRVQKGNPTKESVSWTRISDDKNWENSQLIITNVSRADDTNYTCTVRSTIIPTIGDETLTIRSKTIHLNVFFSSEIKRFTVVKDKSSGTFIVNQRDGVSLECTAEANPASNLSIYDTRGKKISTVKKQNMLIYSINNASYENAGKYICEGRNNYTKDKPSVSKLTMIVKCSPRPSLDSIFPNKIAAAQYTNKTMYFVAYEYLDEENKTEFMWFHKNIAIERNDEKFEIFSIGLNSSLSVRNVTQTDFGEYSVKVSNTIGEYIHHYVLQVEASASDLQPVVYKTSTGTFIGVGMGTFAGTITIVAIFLFCYRRVRKNKHNAGKQDTGGPVYNSHSPYEDLDSNKKDKNVYDQVVTNNLYAQSNSSIMQELSTLPDYNNSMDKESETSVYINMKI